MSGANLVALFLFILGLGATPFGSVFASGFQEVINPPEVSTYYFGRNATGFDGYRTGPLNPSGLNPASGGLTAMIVNGALAPVAWPFDQSRNALNDPDSEGWAAEGR